MRAMQETPIHGAPLTTDALQFDMHLGLSVDAKRWTPTRYTWGAFVAKLKEPTRTAETMKAYARASRAERAAAKDVGGYFGGKLRGYRRGKSDVVHRQLLTLDIDHLQPTDAWWDFFNMAFPDVAAFAHVTHSHTEAAPKWRLLIPLDREAVPDEYVAVARRVAATVGIEWFDDTTYDVNRLMFWPSVSVDAPYLWEEQGGYPLSVDEMLSTYVNWEDSSVWPVSSRVGEAVKALGDKQQNPTEKPGLIGAFCRAYTITEVITRYLPHIYEPVPGTTDRYTYLKGTATAGVVVYDDLFSYSHHGTDPAGGKLLNAYDLVRVHKYGGLDSEEDGGQRESAEAMRQLMTNDDKVKMTLAREAAEKSPFTVLEDEEEAPDDGQWLKELELNSKGKYASNAANIRLILANDRNLKGRIKYNLFDRRQYAVRPLPWRRDIKNPEPLKNVDLSGLRQYVEIGYGIDSAAKMKDGLAVACLDHAYHPVRDYLKSLTWDGTGRADTLFIDYLGAEDNPYTRAAARVLLVGAVARVMQPGVKFDLTVVLTGAQGVGKSALIKKIGGAWFSDSFTTVSGTRAFEQLQGAWIVEIAELSGFRKADMEAVKHFLTKQEDVYRPAYAEAQECYPRQCVFVGTTNDPEFLKDTENRRFLPIVCRRGKKLEHLDVGQLWAEALHLYEAGEPLTLEGEALEMAKAAQNRHTETDELAGPIEEFIRMRLPEDWYSRSIEERQLYVEMGGDDGTRPREFITVAEVWCELLKRDKADMSRYNTRSINLILRKLATQLNSTKIVPPYGKQKYFEL